MKTVESILKKIRTDISVLNDEIKPLKQQFELSSRNVERVMDKSKKVNEKLKKIRTQQLDKNKTETRIKILAQANSEVEIVTLKKRTLKSEKKLINENLILVQRELKIVKKIELEILKLIQDEEDKKSRIEPKKRGRKKKIYLFSVPKID